MMDFLRRHKTVFFIITISGFLGGIVLGFGGYLLGPQSKMDTIATVNGKDIPYKKYSRYLNQRISSIRNQTEDGDISDELLERSKRDIIQQLIQQEIFYQEAKKLGLEVSNVELARQLHATPAFQREGKFDMRTYFSMLRYQIKLTPEEFEEEQRRELMSLKLRRFISTNSNINIQEINRAYDLKYKISPEALSKELEAMTIEDKELEEAYKKKNDDKLDGFKKKKKSFTKEYKAEKHRNNFHLRFKQQFFDDWAQKVTTEVKVKTHLEEIERMRGIRQ